MVSSPSIARSGPRPFRKATLIKGRPAEIDCVDLGGQTFSITRGPVTVIGLEDDWYEDLRDPEGAVATARTTAGLGADLLTFWQRVPDVEPRYPYHLEWEELAVLAVTSYDDWWQHRITSRVRNLVRKAAKEGVTVRESAFDDAFVRGMTAIFNEAPVRQGRPFWHYGKDFDTVKRQFSRHVHREHMIAAYHQDEMIGFIMLGDAGRFGITGQIISSLAHRDKAPNNALVARAVEVCARRGLGHLVYLYWSDDSLAEFKRRCGFERTRVPRYYVPLTRKGAWALRWGLHRGWKQRLPARIKGPLKRLRRLWY